MAYEDRLLSTVQRGYGTAPPLPPASKRRHARFYPLLSAILILLPLLIVKALPDPSPLSTTSNGSQLAVSSSYATLLGLAVACITQLPGSLLFPAGGGYLWRLSPLSCLLDLLVLLHHALTGARRGYSLRQTALAILMARQSHDRTRDYAPDAAGGRENGVLALSAVPVLFLFLRVCGTRGSPATAVIGSIYFASWAAVAGLVLARLWLWDRSTEPVVAAAREFAHGIPAGALVDYLHDWVAPLYALLLLLLYPLFCAALVIGVLQLFGPRPLLARECVRELWIPWGAGAVLFLVMLVKVRSSRNLALRHFLAGPVVFAAGSVAFVKTYKPEQTFRPPWMEWLGR
ncbi:hypothetical protein EDC01DRAFT_640232 [Geopyxis carbonaria]|nr:hypothetical protein EDC01DRAFT_640232 [Geopyxis carbonaria]